MTDAVKTDRVLVNNIYRPLFLPIDKPVPVLVRDDPTVNLATKSRFTLDSYMGSLERLDVYPGTIIHFNNEIHGLPVKNRGKNIALAISLALVHPLDIIYQRDCIKTPFCPQVPVIRSFIGKPSTYRPSNHTTRV